uniref:Uncharacterized protein n=1 Tax=Oryza rufipogon TaxID=4529 RepID=A0A0E0QIX4_ORYRU
MAQQQCSPDKRPIFHSPRLRERATEADPPPSPAPAKRLGGGGRGSGERPFLFPEDGVWLLLQRALQRSAHCRMVGKKVDCISNCRLSSLHLPIPCTSAMNADTEMLEGEKCRCSPQCHRIAPATDVSTTSPK